MNLLKKFPNLKGKAVLAPMSGTTDVAFRALCKQYDAALTYTELISSTALIKANERTESMLKTDPIETLAAVQLFGEDPSEMAAAARIIEDKFCVFKIIDINCGCPATKVMNKGAGSALLRDPVKIGKIIRKVCSAVNLPVTIKIRVGFSPRQINAIEVAKIAEDAGAAAITVHGRTVGQGYSGKADWSIIKSVKDVVNIPVIGNGDVTTPEIFTQRMETSNVDAIMIGRAAASNPYIFRQVSEYMKIGKYSKNFIQGSGDCEVDMAKNYSVLFGEYLLMAEKHEIAFAAVKNHAIQFTRGIRGAPVLRMKISGCKNIRDLKIIIEEFSQ